MRNTTTVTIYLLSLLLGFYSFPLQTSESDERAYYSGEESDEPKAQKFSFWHSDQKFHCLVGTCITTTARISQMRSHLLVHSNKRTHACSFCGEMFKRPDLVTRHELVHTGEKQVKCTLCKVEFTRIDNARAHEKSKVHQRKVKKLKCPKESYLERCSAFPEKSLTKKVPARSKVLDKASTVESLTNQTNYDAESTELDYVRHKKARLQATRTSSRIAALAKAGKLQSFANYDDSDNYFDEEDYFDAELDDLTTESDTPAIENRDSDTASSSVSRVTLEKQSLLNLPTLAQRLPFDQFEGDATFLNMDLGPVSITLQGGEQIILSYS